MTLNPPAVSLSAVMPSELPAGAVDRRSKLFRKNLDQEEAFEAERAAGFAERIRRDLLERVRVSPRDLKAVQEIIPAVIQGLKCYRDFPARGFGLVGPAGCGKSNALVAAIKKVQREEIEAGGPKRWDDLDHLSTMAPTTEFKWVSWPALAARMKGLAARREWTLPDASTEGLISWLETDQEHKRVLVLDDLGMENLKQDSYTTEQLELLIDKAYGLEARLFWTSNKQIEDRKTETGEVIKGLSNPLLYGPRLISRLTGLSPDVDSRLLADLPDLRVRRLT